MSSAMMGSSSTTSTRMPIDLTFATILRRPAVDFETLIGPAFKCPPARVCDPEASNLDRQAVRFYDLNPYRCEPLADEIGHRLKLKLASKQSIHVAAMRCLGQDFERPAMSRTQTL